MPGFISGNHFQENGTVPAPMLSELGSNSRDRLWDLRSTGNTRDQPGLASLPPILPGRNWPRLQRKANSLLRQFVANL